MQDDDIHMRGSGLEQASEVQWLPEEIDILLGG